MHLRPQGKTANTHPELMTPGTLVSRCGQYWILTEVADGCWRGIFLDTDPDKNPATVDSNLRRHPVPPSVLICEPAVENLGG